MKKLLRTITSNLGKEFSSESHVVAEVYYQLRSKANLTPEEIVLENPYTDNSRKKCDILIRQTGHPEVWIEVKGYFASESSSTRSKKHTGEASSPFSACDKLSKLRSESLKMIIIYKNCSYQPRGMRSWEKLHCYCKQNNVILEFID